MNIIMDFYRGILCRLPDSAGYAYWLERFRAAQSGGSAEVYSAVDAISAGFTSSAEYLSRQRSPGQFVGDMYNAFLRRGGDLEGALYWKNRALAGPEARDSIRQAFLASPEFSSRVQDVVAAGCL